MSTVIQVQNLSKVYRLGVIGSGTLRDDIENWWLAVQGKKPTMHQDEVLALDNVSFDVTQGEVLGIIGKNGSGKSTLLKILSRVTSPSAGFVKMKGRVRSLLEVGAGFHSELTGRENIYLNGSILGMHRSEISKKLDEIIDFSGVEKYIDTPVKRYSSGMYVRLAFAVAAHLESEILIIDEVLAVGDADFQKKCLGKMNEVSKTEGRTVLFVSHNMPIVEKLCTRLILLENGHLIETQTPAEAISRYIGNIHKNHKYYTDKSAVREISVQQCDATLEISARYALDFDIRYPCLGFVVTDHKGTRLFGSNPLISGVTEKQPAHRIGQVQATLASPLLLNGDYRLSVWFGDGKEEFFVDENCVEFNVTNMVLERQLPAADVGPISPTCKWNFEIA